MLCELDMIRLFAEEPQKNEKTIPYNTLKKEEYLICFLCSYATSNDTSRNKPNPQLDVDQGEGKKNTKRTTIMIVNLADLI